MDNKELLIFGGSDPYTEATHLLTVGFRDDTYDEYGLDHAVGDNYGSISPSTFEGASITRLFEWYGDFTSDGGSKGWTISVGFGDEGMQDLGKRFSVTNLLTGDVVFDQGWTGVKAGYHMMLGPSGTMNDEHLSLDKFVGQTIPLKFEIVS